MDANHGPVVIEAANERPDDAEEKHGLFATEAAEERTDNVEENHDSVGIEAAQERNDHGEEDHGPDDIEAAHERTDKVEGDHGPLGIESAMPTHERWRYLLKNWGIYIVEGCSIHSANTSLFGGLYLQKHTFFFLNYMIL